MQLPRRWSPACVGESARGYTLQTRFSCEHCDWLVDTPDWP